MVELHDEVIAKAKDRGGTMSTADFLRYIEEYHHEDEPGVPRELVERYAERLADQRRVSFDAESIIGSLDKRLTDDETWTKNALYMVDSDRVSTCPLRWHRELKGTTDLAKFVAVMQKGVDLPDQVPGVRREQVLNAATVLSKIDRETASDRLQTQRREGDITSKAGRDEDLNLQDRNANLYVPDEDGQESTATKENTQKQREGSNADTATIEKTEKADNKQSAEEEADKAISGARENDSESIDEHQTEKADKSSDIDEEPETMPDSEDEPATTPETSGENNKESVDSSDNNHRNS